jgi:hypothetical protein
MTASSVAPSSSPRLSTFTMLLSMTALAVSMACHADSLQEKQLQTLETANFKLLYPAEVAALAKNAAHELEHSKVMLERHQQRVLTEKAEVVVFDPNNAPNGFALPLSHQPTMALFATPPQSDMVLHNMTGWMQLVALHEYVHLVHLAQPHRHEWQNNAGKFIQFADLARLNTPRWASEGYATLLESRLTGYGRLYSHFAEAWLQQLAIEGALPSYENVSDTSGRYQAGGFAYLVGSRYLAWLEQNFGSAQLDAIWTRLNGKEDRDFNSAFTGIYGVSPAILYQRFIAEYSFQALQQQQQRTPLAATLWHDSKGRQQAPALSADGNLLALIEQDDAEQAQLVVLSTAENSKAAAEFKEKQQAILAKDPADIADVAPAVFKREIKHRLEQRNFSGVRDPRWLDANSLVFGADTKDSAGQMHQDLFRWDLDTGNVTALTVEQNLRRFDVSADGRFIIAERNRHGFAQLIKLDLASGQLSELTAPALEHIYDFPRVSPDAQQFAVVHFVQGQGWQLELRHSQDAKVQRIVPMPADYQYLSFPTWSLDGRSLFFVASEHSRLKLYRFELASQQLVALSDGAEMIQMVQPLPNGRLLAQLVNQQGPDLYEIQLTEGTAVTATVTAPVVRRSEGETSWLQPSKLHSAIASVSAQTRQLPAKASTIAQSTIAPSTTAPSTTAPSTAATADNAATTATPVATVIQGLQMPAPQQYDTAPAEATTQDYGLGPQQFSMVVHSHNNDFSPNALGVGIKGGDVLNRLSYQWGVSKDTRHDRFTAQFAEARYQGWPVKLSAKIATHVLTLDRQTGFEHAKEQSDAAVVSLSYPWQQQALTLNAELQLRYLDQQIDTEMMRAWHTLQHRSASLLLTQNWQHQRNSWGLSIGNQLNWHQSLQDSVTSGWRGVDVNSRFAGRYQDLTMALHYVTQRRWQADALLRLGGFSHPALQTELDPNRIGSEELAFQQAIGQDYQRMAVSFSHRNLDALQLSYRRHEFAEQPYIDSYGVSLAVGTGLPLGPVALNDLEIRIGLFRVEPEQGQKDNRVWFNFDYQF